MKKYLPIILFLLGIGIVLAVYFLVIKKPVKAPAEEASSQIEVALEDRPVVSLTPSADGHWLTLFIDKIKIDAATLDYELLYDLPDGRTQGVPGSLTLAGQTKVEKKLLMGSESSGKFRYDEGVEQGDITIRFRNDKGKLLIKFATKFHLQSGVKELTSTDGNFSFILDKKPSKAFFVTMETFGLPEDLVSSITSGPYGIFTSDASLAPGSADGWQKASGSNIFYK
ncbi:MAG: hypothetical protein ABIJ85_04455 [bacterium]